MSATHPVRIGLLGCGVVGSPVARAIIEDPRYQLAAVAVRDPSKQRAVSLPTAVVGTDPVSIAHDPRIDVVIELIGGVEPACSAILTALGSGKPVVTANKELLARQGGDLFREAARRHQELLFEASVGGAIPIVRAITGSLAGDRVKSIRGILNGTCNFVLTEMAATTCPLDEALEKAQALGYAEADPTADIDGRDAAAKLAILARVAFGADTVLDDVACRGIRCITEFDTAAAHASGAVIKHVAQATATHHGLELTVAPQSIDNDDPLASVDGAMNAVVVETERAGRLSFYGQGAGGEPTASAVLGDLAAIAARFKPRRTDPIVSMMGFPDGTGHRPRKPVTRN